MKSFLLIRSNYKYINNNLWEKLQTLQKYFRRHDQTKIILPELTNIEMIDKLMMRHTHNYILQNMDYYILL